MGWGTGQNKSGREVGYLVKSPCDEAGCATEIPLGVESACGGMHDGGDHGCGGYFCEKHLRYHDDLEVSLCAKCFATKPTPADEVDDG